VGQFKKRFINLTAPEKKVKKQQKQATTRPSYKRNLLPICGGNFMEKLVKDEETRD
jgi:hypothetical protein